MQICLTLLSHLWTHVSLLCMSVCYLMVLSWKYGKASWTKSGTPRHYLPFDISTLALGSYFFGAPAQTNDAIHRVSYCKAILEWSLLQSLRASST